MITDESCKLALVLVGACPLSLGRNKRILYINAPIPKRGRSCARGAWGSRPPPCRGRYPSLVAARRGAGVRRERDKQTAARAGRAEHKKRVTAGGGGALPQEPPSLELGQGWT